jgi:hypothetical protein
MTWKDISVKQYQAIQEAIEIYKDEFDKVCAVVAVLFNKSHQDINNMEPRRFIKLSAIVTTLFSFEPRGSAPNRIGRYKISYEITRYKWRQYVEIQHWIKKPFDQCFPLILASAVTPIFGSNDSAKHREVVNNFLDYKFLPSFFAAKKILEQVATINHYFNPEEPIEEEQEIDADEASKVPTPDFGEDDFTEKWGWIYTTKRIADFRNITLDEAFELSTIEALNDMQLIKDLQKHEKKLFRNVTSSS